MYVVLSNIRCGFGRGDPTLLKLVKAQRGAQLVNSHLENDKVERRLWIHALFCEASSYLSFIQLVLLLRRVAGSIAKVLGFKPALVEGGKLGSRGRRTAF